MSNEQPTPVLTSASTILSMGSGEANRVWVASHDGIFYRTDNAWQPVPSGQPLNYLNTLVCADKTLLAGSGSGLIVYSHDHGETWTQSYVHEVTEPVTSLAVSPVFAQDGIALAGTQGAGMLRSLDNGRTWRPANRGMYGRDIMALAIAPTREHGVYVFAGTTGDVYYSPNGGQSWNSSDKGLYNVVVTAIAVSPAFGKDRTVLVGTEAHGVLRSLDRGRTWQPLSGVGEPADATAAKPSIPSINSLWTHPTQAALYLLGTDSGQIFRSADGGATWQLAHTAHAPLMCFGAVQQRIYAGLYEGGLLCSDDDGWTWWKME